MSVCKFAVTQNLQSSLSTAGLASLTRTSTTKQHAGIKDQVTVAQQCSWCMALVQMQTIGARTRQVRRKQSASHRPVERYWLSADVSVKSDGVAASTVDRLATHRFAYCAHHHTLPVRLTQLA